MKVNGWADESRAVDSEEDGPSRGGHGKDKAKRQGGAGKPGRRVKGTRREVEALRWLKKHDQDAYRRAVDAIKSGQVGSLGDLGLFSFVAKAASAIYAKKKASDAKKKAQKQEAAAAAQAKREEEAAAKAEAARAAASQPAAAAGDNGRTWKIVGAVLGTVTVLGLGALALRPRAAA